MITVKLGLSVSCCTAALAWAATASGQPAPQRSGAPDQAPGSGTSASDAGQRAAPTRQDTSAGSSAAVGEVVVTSASRASTLQHIDAAVTAFTDERRNLLGIETGRDVALLTPSVSLHDEYLTIRGVGRYEDPGQGLDPGIAVSVDGVYTSSPAYLNQPDFLTDRIEVFPGPQSLYGRNSIGGTVDVISRRPTDQYHADFRVGYTSDEEGYVDAAVSGPITDTLRFRLAYSGADIDPHGGEQKNIAGGPNPGTGDTRLYEVQLEWEPSPDFDFWTRFQGFSENIRPPYGVATGFGAGTNLVSPYLSTAPYFTTLYYGLAPNPQFGLPATGNPGVRNVANVDLTDVGTERLPNDDTFTINAKWNMHWATLKYIGGYSQYDFVDDGQADYNDNLYVTSPGGRQVPAFYTANSNQDKKFFSHELILNSPDNQSFRWVGGLYYYQEHYTSYYSVDDPLATWLATPAYAVGGPDDAPANTNRSFYAQETALRSSNEAVYGQVDYDLTHTLRLTIGGRYNWDQRYGFNNVREVFDLYGIYGDLGLPEQSLDVTPAPSDQNAKASFADWSGKVVLDWHPDPSTTAYVEVAQGYKSGGFNLNIVAPNPIPTVRPETLTDYEVGLKKTWGRTLLIDLAAYYYDYRNLQVPLTVAEQSGINPVTGVSSVIDQLTVANAQRSHEIGFEAQSVYSPLENLHLTLIYSFLEAKFDRFSDPSGEIQDPASGMLYSDLRGNTVPQTPRNKISFIPNYVAHLPSGDLSLSASYSWVASEYFGVFNTPAYYGPSYYNLDLRAVFQPTKSHWTAILYGRNVTNRNQVIQFQPSTVFPTQSLEQIANRQVFGAELQYRF